MKAYKDEVIGQNTGGVEFSDEKEQDRLAQGLGVYPCGRQGQSGR